MDAFVHLWYYSIHSRAGQGSNLIFPDGICKDFAKIYDRISSGLAAFGLSVDYHAAAMVSTAAVSAATSISWDMEGSCGLSATWDGR